MSCPSCRLLTVEICEARIREREAIVRTIEHVFAAVLSSEQPNNQIDCLVKRMKGDAVRHILRVISDEKIRV